MRFPSAATAWQHVAGFWQHAPRDLKLLVFGIPILLALALHPSSLKKISLYSAAAGGRRDATEAGAQFPIQAERSVGDGAAN